MANQMNEFHKFNELLNRFDTGILVTHTTTHGLHGRPMAIAQVEENCDLWFIADLNSPKIDEIRFDDEVLVTFQNKRDEFVTLCGQAELVRDARKIDELWQESFKIWFPDGKSDSSLTLLHIHARQGEYWDNGGMNKVSYMFESLRAYASGDTPHIQEGSQHGKVHI